jgi:membrane-bound lytic murein transglycosylase B
VLIAAAFVHSPSGADPAATGDQDPAQPAASAAPTISPSQDPAAVPAATPSPAAAQAAPVQVEDARPIFADWLAAVRAEALERGLRAEIVDEALSTVEAPMPVVIERDRSQAELVETLETYLSRRVTPRVIDLGREMAAKHRELLDRISARYGVTSAMLVAVWGAESNFGRFSGVHPTVPALTTLAFDPRRSTLFRKELFNALEILNRGDIALDRMRGSWAGAMGQPQFMPSSYLQFAEDFDGDGMRDIWGSPGDIFASIANYLKGYGWVPGERWGREVSLSRAVADRVASGVSKRTSSCRASREMNGPLPLDEWQKLGVRLSDGSALPTADQQASLVSGTTRHFLVYGNYDVLLSYNCAHAYALGVGLLADRVAAR